MPSGIERRDGTTLGAKVRAMKKLLVLTILFAAMFIAGCGLADMNYDQRENRYRNKLAMDARMMIDDFDYFWLVDRPSRLTYWYVRSGD